MIPRKAASIIDYEYMLQCSAFQEETCKNVARVALQLQMEGR
jgi:hypothetical protein